MNERQERMLSTWIIVTSLILALASVFLKLTILTYSLVVVFFILFFGNLFLISGGTNLVRFLIGGKDETKDTD